MLRVAIFLRSIPISVVLILLAAGLMGMALIEMVLSPFKELSGVKEGDVYWESFLYFALVIGCSLATFLPVTFYFNKRTLQSNIQQKTVNRWRSDEPHTLRNANSLLRIRKRLTNKDR